MDAHAGARGKWAGDGGFRSVVDEGDKVMLKRRRNRLRHHSKSGITKLVLRPDDLLAFQPHASAWGSHWSLHNPTLTHGALACVVVPMETNCSSSHLAKGTDGK